MKKRILTSCAILGLLLAFNTSYAQESSDLQIGGGAIYGLEVEAIGIQAGAKYAFTEEISGAAEFAVDFASIYTELKYVLGNADQLALSAGLRFNI